MSSLFPKALILGCAFWAATAASQELRVCAEPDNLPFSRRDESGFENRIARLVAGDLSLRLRYVWASQRRAFVRKTFGEGLCDVWMGVPAGFERTLTTRPYYRSSYVFVFSQTRVASFQDPDLKKVRIGVQLPGDDLAATPPGHALALRGAIDKVVGFTVYGERPVGQRMVEAIAAGKLDAALIWGPAAGYFAHREKLHVSVAHAPPELASLPFQFSIAIGVRKGEAALRDRLNEALERRKPEIDAILDAYAVPRVSREAN